MARYITEIIQEEYRRWENKDIVLITAPTGSGKTFFVLNKLLPFFAVQYKKILYLVNRKILKEQLKESISDLPLQYRDMIKVETYQSIESEIRSLVYNPTKQCYTAAGYEAVSRFENYDCVVCDECHYFLEDANYNGYTWLSFDWINGVFWNKQRIFMSATINDIENYIRVYEQDQIRKRMSYYNSCFSPAIQLWASTSCPIKSYGRFIDRDYDYIDIHIIKRDDIKDTVLDGKDKWLIFVDTIDFGKKLEKELKEAIKLEDNGKKTVSKTVIMIDSSYKKKEDISASVKVISRKNILNEDIVISTSVMDNGISIKDVDLRNIVMIADTEVEFIQMLGRKRKDGKNLNLYLVQQTWAELEKRRQRIIKIRNEIYLGNLYYPEADHMWQMQRIANQEIQYSDISAVYNIYDGKIQLNAPAVYNIEKKYQYYNTMKEKFEQYGKYALVKEQIKWLGKTETQADLAIRKCICDRIKKYRGILIKKFNEILDQEKTKDEIIEWKQKQVSKDIERLINYVIDYRELHIRDNSSLSETQHQFESKKTTIMKNLGEKNNRNISPKNIDFLREFCGLPYKLVLKRGIKKIKTVSMPLHQNQ